MISLLVLLLPRDLKILSQSRREIRYISPPLSKIFSLEARAKFRLLAIVIIIISTRTRIKTIAINVCRPARSRTLKYLKIHWNEKSSNKMTSDRLLFSQKESRPQQTAGNDSISSGSIKARHEAFNEFLTPHPLSGEYPGARTFWIHDASRKKLIDENLIKVGYLNVFMSMPHQKESWHNKKCQRKIMAALRAIMFFERYIRLGEDEACYDDEHPFCLVTNYVLMKAAEDPMVVHILLSRIIPSVVDRKSVLLKCVECNQPESHPRQFLCCSGCGVMVRLTYLRV